MSGSSSNADSESHRPDLLKFQPGPIPPLEPVDKFGFLKRANVSSGSASAPLAERERDERRLRKWRKMIGVGGADWKQYVKRNPKLVKRRIRKGIPDCLRGLVWQLISGSRDLLLNHQGVYGQLVLYENSVAELDIIRDISRTFPSHVYYQQRHGPGQRCLYNVLKAYSVYDPDVGYVQVESSGNGIFSRLAAALHERGGRVLGVGGSTQRRKECTHERALLGKLRLHHSASDVSDAYEEAKVGLPLVQQYLFQFDRLVHELLPALGAHFEREVINPSMYASQWFITVFSYSFPFSLSLRIWDVFLHEGMKIVFRVGLALLKYCQLDLVRLPFEKLVQSLKNFPEEALQPDVILPIAYSIKVSRRLEELLQDYNQLKNPTTHGGKDGVEQNSRTEGTKV